VETGCDNAADIDDQVGEWLEEPMFFSAYPPGRAHELRRGAGFEIIEPRRKSRSSSRLQSRIAGSLRERTDSVAGEREDTVEEREAIQEAEALAKTSEIAMLATNGDGGYPNIKAIIKMENEGLKTIWFSTNTSSRRVQQLARDSKACVYFVDMDNWKGLMLVGEVQILQDRESRERLWREGYERYYPMGVTDPDYTVLRFTSAWGNYYHALSNVTFEL
jgi:general stress protein 26